MKAWRACLGWLALGCVVLLAGCGDGESQTIVKCPDLCEVGEATCEGDGVAVVCEADESGCGFPVVTVCGEDEACTEGACEARVCDESACEIGERDCGDDNTQIVCVEGRDGCGIEVEVSCGDGAVCIEGACVGACVDGDGDGFGEGCEAGPDCDDGDREVNPDAEEVCDSRDNDCDTDIDEDFELAMDCTEGVGACAVEGKVVCSPDGTATVCDATPGEPGLAELCGNLIDDDCNGETDEGFELLGEVCLTGLGICQVEGVFVCAEDGSGEVCEGEPGEPEEVDVCDGLDNDCDGEIDDDFPTLGEDCTLGDGICEASGTIVCNEAGDDAVCDATPGEANDIELCGNGLDDDCNGETDEGFDDLGTLCEVGDGICRAVGVQICAEDGVGTVCGVGEGEANDIELCGNGLDDNCNGEIDEGFEALGTACEVGEGACGDRGAFVCNEDRTALVCGAQEGEPAEGELCDSLDNNCDGNIDEGFDNLGDDCVGGLGICERAGQFVCAIDGSRTVCSAEPGAPEAEELCGNNLDDDCDGEVDEGFEAEGDRCSEGQGVCAEDGVLACAVDLLSLVCDAEPGEEGVEECNGLDDDCDGEIDGPEICGECVNDNAEPNDVVEDATPLAVGGTAEGTLCFFDRDIYSLGQLEDGAMIINVLFSHDEGDIDLGVFRDGEFVTGAVSSDDNEQVLVLVEEPGEYTIHLAIISGVGSPDYRLSVVGGNPPCLDDIFEHDDTPELSHPLLSGETREMVACANDRDEGGDWFDLGFLESETRITLNAEFDHEQGDIDLFLHDEEGEVVETALSLNDDEEIDVVVIAPGRYFARTEVLGQGLRNVYSLTFERDDDFCIDDDFEDTDDAQNALLVGPGQRAAARACLGDDDFYQLNRVYQPGEIIQVNATFDRAGGDLDLELLLGGVLVAVGNSGNSNETIRHIVRTAGVYQVRAFAVDGQPSYQLSHVPPRTDACIPDPYEFDDFFTIATTGVEGATFGMTACPVVTVGDRTDFDFVTMGDLVPGERIRADLTFIHARGNIDLFLFSEGEIITSSLTADDNEALDFTVVAPGEYMLIAFLNGGDPEGDGNAYRLRYTID